MEVVPFVICLFDDVDASAIKTLVVVVFVVIFVLVAVVALVLVLVVVVFVVELVDVSALQILANNEIIRNIKILRGIISKNSQNQTRIYNESASSR